MTVGLPLGIPVSTGHLLYRAVKEMVFPAQRATFQRKKSVKFSSSCRSSSKWSCSYIRNVGEINLIKL